MPKIVGADSASEPKSRQPRPGYRRVTISLSEANYSTLTEASKVAWMDLNDFLSRQIELHLKDGVQLLPQLDLFDKSEYVPTKSI
jgi:hypothetical protein